MIIKKSEIPLIILKLQALLRRLLPQHPQVSLITQEFRRRLAGYNGETSLDYHLSFLEANNYYIFHDLRLHDETSYFQIDILLLSEKFVLIVEVKNYAGSIFLDPKFNQVIQNKEGQEKALPDPTLQIKRHEDQLKNWLLKHDINDVPIFSFVVISNPQTIIRTTPENQKLHHKVIHSAILPNKIKQFEKSTKQAISQKQLKKAIRLFKKHHTPADVAILDRFKITKEEVLKGVICSNCKHTNMQRIHGTWFCTKCNHKCKEAHIEALKDYMLLFGPKITNSELRDFFNIDSSATATRILQSLKIPSVGINKSKEYTLSFTFNETKL